MADDLNQQEQDTTIERIWTIVYSDMITNLMLFFLMLYGLSRMGVAARGEIMKGMQDKFRGKTAVEFKAQKVLSNIKDEEAVQKVNSFMEKQGVNKYTSVEINEKQIKITLTIPVLFASGNANLAESAKTALGEVAKVIQSVPNTVVIEGHTDNIPVSQGPYPSNWELSVARAYSVIEFFVKEKKIDPSRFVTAGYGEFRPIAANDTPEGRASNRRIEIVMVRK
jgi:chemotaxis protein MotB